MASEGIFTTTPLELILGTYATSASAIATTASAGTAKTVSRGDHVHSIALATGDSNGQVKIAGSNVSVKGLGTAAYTASTAYRAALAPASGAWFQGTPTVSSSGVTEIGKYLDFHSTSAGTSDYDVRITATTTGITISGTTTGTFSGNVTGNCSGSSGSCTGLAAKATGDKNGADITTTYLKLSGGTMTGNITMSANTFVQKAGGAVSYIKGRDSALIKTTSYSGYGAILSAKTTDGTWEIGTYSSNTLRFIYSSDANYNSNTNTVINVYIDANGKLTAPQVANAIWNDYAEYRCSNCEDQYGRCVIDQDDGKMILANKRLLSGAKIISDTWGHTMGETEDAKTPIAVAGRVLVYPYKNRNKYHAGQCVCTAPNGTVDIMTRAEIITHPDAIIGIVSEIPNYETWGTGNVKVDGRIWVYVR